LTVHAGDGSMGFRRGGHFDKTETSRFAGELILDYRGRFDLSECFKSLS